MFLIPLSGSISSVDHIPHHISLEMNMERGDVHSLLEALHEAGVDATPGIYAFFQSPVAVDFVDQGWRVLLDMDVVNGENNEGFELVLRERGLRWRFIHKTHGTYMEIYNPQARAPER